MRPNVLWLLGSNKLLSWLMSLCGRCRQVPPLTGDAYCISCAAWEAIGRELQANWPVPGYRPIVSEILVAGSRQIRALRNLAAAQSVAAGNLPSRAEGSERTKVKVEPQQEDQRSAIPRSRKSSGSGGQRTEDLAAHPKSRGRKLEKDEQASQSEDTDEESEEEPPVEHHRPLGDSSHRRPPGPDGHRGVERKKEDSNRGKGWSEHPWRKRERSRHRDRRPEERRGRHRAGRKHQRLARCLTDPFKVVHRKLPDSFLEERVEDKGLAALTLWWRERRSLTRAWSSPFRIPTDGGPWFQRVAMCWLENYLQVLWVCLRSCGPLSWCFMLQ